MVNLRWFYSILYKVMTIVLIFLFAKWDSFVGWREGVVCNIISIFDKKLKLCFVYVCVFVLVGYVLDFWASVVVSLLYFYIYIDYRLIVFVCWLIMFTVLVVHHRWSLFAFQVLVFSHIFYGLLLLDIDNTLTNQLWACWN